MRLGAIGRADRSCWSIILCSMSIHLLSTIDAGYEVPFRVTLQSMLDHLDAPVSVQWHVIGSGLTALVRDAIEVQASGKPLTFHWYETPASLIADLPVRGRFVSHVYARIIAPQLLPAHVNRFLYLDGDLLLMDSISALWETDLEGAVIGAVQDMAVPRVSSPMGIHNYRELGFNSRDPYFNAGVYLVDLAAWRKRDAGQRAIDYIKHHGDSINLLDQEALNVALHGCWKQLDLRWNLIASLAGRRHYKPEGSNLDLYHQAVEHPGIVHFAGLLKPWVQANIGSQWVQQYLRTLQQACPGHQLSDSIRDRGFSFYDRKLRWLFYAAEKYVWSKRKGF